MLRTTPESLREILPREYPELALAITADARIDNRSELIQSLQLQERQASEISDSYLIAMAYRRWGENSPQMEQAILRSQERQDQVENRQDRLERAQIRFQEQLGELAGYVRQAMERQFADQIDPFP